MRWTDPPDQKPDLSAGQAAQLLRDRRLGAALIERAAIAAARGRAGLDPAGDQGGNRADDRDADQHADQASRLRRAVLAHDEPARPQRSKLGSELASRNRSGNGSESTAA